MATPNRSRYLNLSVDDVTSAQWCCSGSELSPFRLEHDVKHRLTTADGQQGGRSEVPPEPQCGPLSGATVALWIPEPALTFLGGIR